MIQGKPCSVPPGHSEQPLRNSSGQFSSALRVLSTLQDTTSFHKHRDAVLFPGGVLLSPSHPVFLKKLINPFNDKPHFPGKIHTREVSDDSSTLQDRQQRIFNTTTMHRRFPTCCCPGNSPEAAQSWSSAGSPHLSQSPTCHPKAVTYSIGNQSPQSCLTVSMSSWQSRRRFTSVSAAEGTSSVIHACRGRKHQRSDGTRALIQQHHQGLARDKAAVPRKVSLQER